MSEGNKSERIELCTISTLGNFGTVDLEDGGIHSPLEELITDFRTYTGFTGFGLCQKKEKRR